MRPSAAAARRIETHDRREDDPTRGFRHFGEFCSAIRVAANPGVRGIDERLLIGAAAPGVVGSEGIGADGGFAVPPQFAGEIWTYADAEDALLPLCDDNPIESNSMVFPKDENLPWGSDGLRAYWTAENTVGTPVKPKLGADTLRFNKLLAYFVMSEELWEDGAALASYLPKRIGMAVRFKINEAILFGLGNGTPIGCMNSNAAITNAKESGQLTGTFAAANFTKMVSRLAQGSFGRSIWLIGPDCLSALFGVNFGSYPLYAPDNAELAPGMAGPVCKLLGRPCYESQHAAAFSSQGDVLLLDLAYYTAITKANDPASAVSLHMYFDQFMAAFRTSFRLDGAPKIVAPIAQAKGTNTLSPFVQLGAR